MLVVPVQAVPSQTLAISLGGQSVRLSIYYNDSKQPDCAGLYMDVLVNSVPIISGVLCQNANRIVRDAYLGFIGDFAWYDTQGTDDPYYPGLGGRWFLAYLEASDLASLGLTG